MRVVPRHLSCRAAGLALAVVIVLPSAGLAQEVVPLPPPQTPESEIAQVLIADRYRLRPSDVVEIEFRFTPEFNQSVSVLPDGYVTLRGIGELRAAGLTVPELKHELVAAFSTFMRDPEIDVVLREFDRPFFIAGGEVNQPGKYELRGRTTIFSGVSIAGGFTQAAKHSRVWLYRHRADGQIEAREFDYKRMLNKGTMDGDELLQPNDIVFVPTSGFSKFERYFILPVIYFFLNPRFY